MRYTILAVPILLFAVSCKKEVQQLAATSETISNVVPKPGQWDSLFWNIEDTMRKALVWWPADMSTIRPFMMGLHGHNNDMYTMRTESKLHTFWPEAITVYPQGLRSTGGGDPNALRTGWQHAVGEVNQWTGIRDQDVKFYDAMMATFDQYIDRNKIFLHGRSNGGELIFDVLWTLDKRMKAACTSGSVNDSTTGKRPHPWMHTAGLKDGNVPFEDQRASFDEIRILNQCSQNGTLWAHLINKDVTATRYPSAINCPSIFVSYDGGHPYPGNVPQLIVRFFKEVQ